MNPDLGALPVLRSQPSSRLQPQQTLPHLVHVSYGFSASGLSWGPPRRFAISFACALGFGLVGRSSSALGGDILILVLAFAPTLRWLDHGKQKLLHTLIIRQPGKQAIERQLTCCISRIFRFSRDISKNNSLSARMHCITLNRS